ncbi:hypothetical protein LTR56_016592 [Elasticomyces elasticus]|nr:hypothetical protein LTR56_016592 [Elasticomyces elasticus]KAK3650623.1 hypothetical protein LTR22_012481 [Elasticomyces elasticus]KAK4913956.1 hypothetical protein LTR49_017774 [Elasticomyces elasticus]KAK5753120.1 hypothetical protein LTS12_016799 [Elasticomyces elasticus]
MHAKLGASTDYTTVAVLMVHWAEHLDWDLNARSEVEPLATLFREDFGFDVKIVQLDNRLQRPQLQLDRAIADLVQNVDGHPDDHLLIVFYTGHGYVRDDRPHELIISGTAQEENAIPGQSFAPSASWTVAEQPLETAQTDTLVILDCCCAGNVMTTPQTVANTRSYELMAATGRDMVAIQPGPRSYTHALIKALKMLRRENETFSTAELNQKVSMLQNYNGA